MQFYTSANIPQDLAQRSYAANIARIMPNGGAPLFALSGMAKTKTAKNIEHGYWSKEMVYPKATIDNGGGYNDLATQLTVVTTAEMRAGMVLRHQPSYNGAAQVHSVLAEQIYVVNVDSSTQITVQRGWAGTTPQAVADSSVLIGIGTAHEQGSNSPLAMAIVPVRHMNYTQIFRNAWDITGTLAAIQMEMGYNSVSENKEDCSALHAQDIEKTSFFGKKHIGTKNGRPISTTDGIEQLIAQYAPANLVEAGSSTNYTQLEAMLNPLFDKVTDAMFGNVRTLFVGSQAHSVINNIGRLSGQYQIVDGQTGFGLQFKQFKTSRGVFNMIEHPLFNTNDDWKKMAVALDLSAFDFAYLEGRDTFHTEIYSKERAPNGKDASGGVLTTELTIELQNPFASGIIYNLRAAA